MKYNLLGNTGVLVSELCLGAMTFGTKKILRDIGEQPQEEVTSCVRTALEKGINFIDTANAYSEGLSEIMLGKSLKDLAINRQHVVIAIKLRARMGEGVNQVGLSRLHIADSVNEGLQRLSMDHIDLLYIHGVDKLTPLEETITIKPVIPIIYPRVNTCLSWI
jgi:aryl-alcohol dehydrogenase-like predicted oxidoreductase